MSQRCILWQRTTTKMGVIAVCQLKCSHICHSTYILARDFLVPISHTSNSVKSWERNKRKCALLGFRSHFGGDFASELHWKLPCVAESRAQNGKHFSLVASWVQLESSSQLVWTSCSENLWDVIVILTGVLCPRHQEEIQETNAVEHGDLWIRQGLFQAPMELNFSSKPKCFRKSPFCRKERWLYRPSPNL